MADGGQCVSSQQIGAGVIVLLLVQYIYAAAAPKCQRIPAVTTPPLAGDGR